MISFSPLGGLEISRGTKDLGRQMDKGSGANLFGTFFAGLLVLAGSLVLSQANRHQGEGRGLGGGAKD